MDEKNVGDGTVEEMMQHPMNKGVLVSQVGSKAVFFDTESEKYLVLTPSVKKNEKQTLEFPGGRVDAGETSIDAALERELSEELGEIDYENTGITVTEIAQTFGGMNYTLFFSLLLYRSGEITLSDEHDEYLWVTAEDILSKDTFPDRIRRIIVEVEKKREMIDAQDRMLRTLAEFDNYKKRSSEQQKDFAKYASEKVIMEMLPVLDNFHAATGFVPEEQKDSPWLTGIMYIQQQMEKVFEDAGVRAIEVAVGDAFDAQKMEAIKAQDETQNADESDNDVQSTVTDEQQKIVKVVQKGYMIGDRVMRVARVELG